MAGSIGHEAVAAEACPERSRRMVAVEEEEAVFVRVGVAGDANGDGLSGQEVGAANGKGKKVARWNLN